MLLSLYNDRPSSEAHFAAIGKDSLLERLKALDSRVNRKGLGGLDPGRNRLIRIGMEIDAQLAVIFGVTPKFQRLPNLKTSDSTGCDGIGIARTEVERSVERT